MKQQYLEFRSEGAKTFELREGLNVTPYAGVKLRHTLEGGYQERNAGDFNLSMNSGSETAVDSIVGLKLDYAGKDGWSANAAGRRPEPELCEKPANCERFGRGKPAFQH